MNAIATSREFRTLTRRDLEGRIELVAHLVAEWMDLGSAQTLQNTFPQIYHPLAKAQHWGCMESGSMLAHLVSQQVQLNPGQRILLLGSVCTRPDQRGQGLASSLIAQVCQQAQADGLDAVLLWSDRHDFYQRLGFTPVGLQYEIPFSCPSGTNPTGLRLAQAKDLEQLWALHQQKPMAVQRSLGQMALALMAQPMTTVVRSEAGEITAYACLGKGADLQGWWHEFGGSDPQVWLLLQEAMAWLGLKDSILMLPGYRRQLLAQVQAQAQAQVQAAATLPSALPSALGLDLRGGCPSELFLDGLDSI